MSGGTLSVDLIDIEKLLDDLDHRLPFVTSTDELGQAMCEVTALRSRVQATATRLARAADANGVAVESKQRTVGQYVAARTNTAAVEVDRMCRTAHWLRDYPIFEAAHGHELSPAHVDYLRRKLDTSYHAHCLLRDWQQFFVDTAAETGFTEFVQACEYWLVHVDPDGKEPIDQILKSKLQLTKGAGGRVKISGECDAITGQALRTALDHVMNTMRREEKEAGELTRTQAQRRIAALTQLVTNGFARDDGSFPAPLVNIVMSQQVAEWALATLNGQPTDSPGLVPMHPTAVDGRCELIDGTPIHPFLAVAALGLTTNPSDPFTLRRLVMSADSRVLDVSVNARTFPEWMRTASLVQSRGACDTHGCDAPHSWLEIDHIDPVAHGGETRFDNAQPQCRPDNQAKAATTGHIAWRDRPPPPRQWPRRRKPFLSNDDDPDDDATAGQR